MDSERKIVYGMATAPPPPPPQEQPPPYNYNPQHPPQYGFQFTQPPPPPSQPYNLNSQPPPPPPPPYSYNPPPPPYAPTSTATSYAPPPAYSPHDTQQAGVPTQVPGVNYGLYPNLISLQQQEVQELQHKHVPMINPTNASTAAAPVPLRPAPPIPPPPPPTQQTSQSITSSSFAHLKEGETPSGHALQWRGGEGLDLFFVQREGFVVSPRRKQWIMSVYKKICVKEGCIEGMIEVHGCWRLKLSPNNTQVLYTTQDSYYAFKDASTTPNRVVVIHLPSDVTKRMSEDLLNLLTELTDLRKEDGGIIEKVTTGVATVYDDITHKLNSVVKGTIPSAHKNTKWLRKNTGSLVRMGGSLVAKGIHIVADHIPATTTSDHQQQEEECGIHSDLLSQLKVCKKCLEENSVTYVN